MKLSGRSVPFWAWRPGTRKGRTLFSVYRVIEASSKGIKTDKRVGSLYYGSVSINNTDDEFSYTTFIKTFRDVIELHNDYKKNLLISILENL